MIPFIWNHRTGKSKETESKLVVTRSWGREKLANGHEVNFGGDQNFLEVDSGDSYTTLWYIKKPLK